MKKLFFFIGLVMLFIVIVGLISQKSQSGKLTLPIFENTITSGMATKDITVAGIVIKVEIAQTNEQKSKGLAGRTSLADNQGMLFPLSATAKPQFWMKNMLIPIDIIWIKDGKITKIDANVQPPQTGTKDTQLTIYSSTPGVDYVLEVRGNLSSDKGIKVGDSVE